MLVLAITLGVTPTSQAAQCEEFVIYSGYTAADIDTGPVDPNWACAFSGGMVETAILAPGSTYVQVYWYGAPPTGILSIDEAPPITLAFYASGIPEGPVYYSDPVSISIGTQNVVAEVNGRTASVSSVVPE